MNKDINKRYIVAGIGELLWDLSPENKRLGGAPANFAIHAKALGANAGIISAVGHDPDGAEIIRRLAEKQLVTNFIAQNNHPTGKVHVQLDPCGHPSYTIEKNAAWDFIELSPEAEKLAAECDAVCFGSLAQRNSLSRMAIQRFLLHTPDPCLRIFDINLRQSFYSKDILETSLGIANVLKLNEDELTVLQDLLALPHSTEHALRTVMERFGLRYIALTRGAAGSLMMSQNDMVLCPGIPVTIQDTVGAGDSFTATMTMGILYGLPLDTVNRIAGHVAAYICSHAGATPDLPAWLIAEFHEKIAISIKEVSNLNSEELKKQTV